MIEIHLRTLLPRRCLWAKLSTSSFPFVSIHLLQATTQSPSTRFSSTDSSSSPSKPEEESLDNPALRRFTRRLLLLKPPWSSDEGIRKILLSPYVRGCLKTNEPAMLFLEFCTMVSTNTSEKNQPEDRETAQLLLEKDFLTDPKKMKKKRKEGRGIRIIKELDEFIKALASRRIEKEFLEIAWKESGETTTECPRYKIKDLKAYRHEQHRSLNATRVEDDKALSTIFGDPIESRVPWVQLLFMFKRHISREEQNNIKNLSFLGGDDIPARERQRLTGVFMSGTPSLFYFEAKADVMIEYTKLFMEKYEGPNYLAEPLGRRIDWSSDREHDGIVKEISRGQLRGFLEELRSRRVSKRIMKYAWSKGQGRRGLPMPDLAYADDEDMETTTEVVPQGRASSTEPGTEPPAESAAEATDEPKVQPTTEPPTVSSAEPDHGKT